MSVNSSIKEGRSSLATLPHVSYVSSAQDNPPLTSKRGGTTAWLTELQQALRFKCQMGGSSSCGAIANNVNPLEKSNLKKPYVPGMDTPVIDNDILREAFRNLYLKNPGGERLPRI